MKPARLLTFDWHAHDRSYLRMALSLVVTLVAFIGMFIVFRVVTPDSRPMDVRPQRVLLLNPKEPAELALIHQAMDRSFGLLPSEPSPIQPLKSLKLPTFEPSYAKHELRLKSLPSGLTTSAQTRPFALDMNVLPPLPQAEITAPKPPPVNHLYPLIEGTLAARAAQAVAIPNVPLADASRPRFQVAVGPLGQVLVALPLSISDDELIQQKLHQAILQMRFTPAPETETDWGQISFQWVKEAEAP